MKREPLPSSSTNAHHLSTLTIMQQQNIPQRFDCSKGFAKESARQALHRDGSIILTNVLLHEKEKQSSSSWSEIASLVPTHVWEPEELLLRRHRADAVHVEHEALNLQGEALASHSDGYMWGDRYPDIVILVCEEPADNQGGANFLIDGHSVIGRLKTPTKDLLCNELVDHTERGENNYVQGAESIVPLIRYLDAQGWRKRAASIQATEDGDDAENSHKHLCWRRMVSKDASKGKANADGSVPYTSLWVPVPGTSTAQSEDTIKEALWEVDQAIAAEEAAASRFLLEKGEALIVDNFRMLHSREAFRGSENKRRMWRVWSWTDAAFGLPPQIEASGDNVPSTILQAEKMMQANDA